MNYYSNHNCKFIVEITRKHRHYKSISFAILFDDTRQIVITNNHSTIKTALFHVC